MGFEGEENYRTKKALELAKHVFNKEASWSIEWDGDTKRQQSCMAAPKGGTLDSVCRSTAFRAVHDFASTHVGGCCIMKGFIDLMSEISVVPQLNDLVAEIELLRNRQGAVNLLLDVVEHEAETIDRQIRLKTANKQSLVRNAGGKMGFGWQMCGTRSVYDDELSDDLVAKPGARGYGFDNDNRYEDSFKSRSALQKPRHGFEDQLLQREDEIQRLREELAVTKHELAGVTRANATLGVASERMRESPASVAFAAAAVAPVINADPTRDLKHSQLIERAGEHRQRVRASYAAFFSRAGRVCKRVVFLGWQQQTKQRRRLDRTFKQSVLALLATGRRRVLAVYVASWRGLTCVRRELHQRIHQRTAMVFACMSTSALVRATVIEWWRTARRAKADAHIRLAQAEAEKAAAWARENILHDPELLQLGKKLQYLRDRGTTVPELIEAVDEAMVTLKARLQGPQPKAWSCLPKCCRSRPRPAPKAAPAAATSKKAPAKGKCCSCFGRRRSRPRKRKDAIELGLGVLDVYGAADAEHERWVGAC